jgi:DNA polymerase III subunit alpha
VVLRGGGAGAQGNIRFGLDAVKNVGAAAVDAILAARERGGPFGSIWDFCRRVDARAVNKKAIESLIKCGALDSTGASRRGMLEALPRAQSAGQKAQQDAELGQASIFDLESPGAASAEVPLGEPGAPVNGDRHDPPVPPLPDDRDALGAMEKETLGLFLSSHPLKEIRPALRARVECSLADLAERRDGDWVTVGGMIAECKRIRTKRGDPMMFATLDDLEGQVELLVFNAAYASNAAKIAVDRVVIVRGRVDHKERGETKLVAQEVEPFEPSRTEVERAALEAVVPPTARRITLLVASGVADSFLDELKDVVRSFPGDHELMLRVGGRNLILGPDFRVSASSACRADLAALPGAGQLLA